MTTHEGLLQLWQRIRELEADNARLQQENEGLSKWQNLVKGHVNWFDVYDPGQ